VEKLPISHVLFWYSDILPTGALISCYTPVVFGLFGLSGLSRLFSFFGLFSLLDKNILRLRAPAAFYPL